MVWERQALTKSRWVAGDAEFCSEITETLDHLTYSRSIEADDVEEIRRVRERMVQEIAGETSGEFHDIKMGRGGLVDIEFAVQVLQLCYGHDLNKVRSPATMKALKNLKESGLVEDKQYNALRLAYLFFREVENRTQLYQDRSDSRIPTDEQKVELLARRLGYVGEGDSPGGFLEKVMDAKVSVRTEYEKLLASVEKISS